MFQFKRFNFNDFSTKKKYCELQYNFLMHDERTEFNEVQKEPIEDFEITISFEDPFEDNSQLYNSFFLRSDYLIPGIEQLSDNHFRTFKSKIIDNSLLMEEQIDGLAKLYIDNIERVRGVYSEADYLNNWLKRLLNNQLDNLIDLIESYLSNPFPNIKTKIEFNWNRTDVICFFNLLREKKQISFIGDSDLGRIIDNIFCFSTRGKYLDIRNSRKHLTAFKNFKERPQTEALKRLKNVFSDEDFYALE